MASVRCAYNLNVQAGRRFREMPFGVRVMWVGSIACECRAGRSATQPCRGQRSDRLARREAYGIGVKPTEKRMYSSL